MAVTRWLCSTAQTATAFGRGWLCPVRHRRQSTRSFNVAHSTDHGVRTFSTPHGPPPEAVVLFDLPNVGFTRFDGHRFEGGASVV